MRKFLIAGTLLLASLVGRAQTATVISHAHKTTYQIEQRTVLDGAMCSGTAVGPHALLTATHCEMGSDELEIRGVDDPVKIVGRIRDDSDHTIFLVSGITFTAFSRIDIGKKLQQGDAVFMVGNPGDWSDIFRRGYFAGNEAASPFSEVPPAMLFDMNIWHGDSGAAIFAIDGSIVGVVSLIESQKSQEGSAGMVLEGSLQMKFTPEQINRAETFGSAKESTCQHLLQLNCSIR